MEEKSGLIKKARQHDSAAFSQLMQQHGQSMYKVARAILKTMRMWRMPCRKRR